MTNKDIAVREIIKNFIEPKNIYLKRIRGTVAFSHKYQSNRGKKINIKTVSDKGSDGIWVDVAINDLKDMDFFIFCWFDKNLKYKCSYVIPSDFLQEKLEKHGRKDKKGRRYNFDIKVGDVLFLDKENTYPINEYRNKFSIL